MKEIRKRPESEGPIEVVGKRPRTAALSEAEEEELFFSGEEEALMQLMKVLEEEISSPAANAYNGDTNANPSSSSSLVMYSPPFSSSSSFVTINGNEESCGPSFSDSASTVMASIDMGGISISYFMGPTNSGPLDFPVAREEQLWPGFKDFSVSAISGEGINIDGCEFEVDAGESDDEWLARVLSGAPFEFEE